VTGADLLFHNGPALLPTGERALAVAVTAGRITAIGADAVAARDDRTVTVDLAGRLLIPGFQDAHCHPVWAGLELDACDLSTAETQLAYLDLIRGYAKAHPERAWITGGGWAMDAFPGGLPRREALDAVISDRPVYLPNRDHHGAWVNSRALELAGIDERTPDPPDGRIERDPDGRPTGMLQEGAVDLVAAVIPAPDAATLRHAVLAAQQTMHAHGVTAWQDALVGAGLGQPDVFDAYLSAAEDGVLTARVRASLWWRRRAGLDQLDLLQARRAAAARHARFCAPTVKIMVDGVAENYFAALLTPYLDGCGACRVGDRDHELDTNGVSFVDAVALREYATALDAAGFQLHFHTLGDRAVREALDAVAAARAANGPSAGRHHLAHLQVVHPDDVARLAELGVTATIQPLWAAHEPQMDGLTIPYLGAPRAGWQYPFADLASAGATLAAGSDWPVSSVVPMEGIHVAVNRQLPQPEGPVFLPHQRLTLAQAMHAYTAGSAFVNGLDDTGAIRVGALADLTVLDRDPFALPTNEIASTGVLATYVEGVAVFDAR